MNRYRIAAALLGFAVSLPAASGFAGGGPSPLRVTDRECIEMALRNNPDLAVSRQERRIAETRVPFEESAFLPRFTAEISASRSVSPTGSSLDNALSLDQREIRADVGISERFRTGTTLSLDFRNRLQESSSAVFLLSPEYDTSLTLTAIHPLLRDGGRDSAEAPLRVARAGAEAGDADFRARLMDLVASVRVRFVALRSALREVDVRKTALSLAERLRSRTVAEIEAGARPPVDRLPAEAAVASRREEWLRAAAAARNAEDDLKVLLGMSAQEEWDRPLDPQPPSAPIDPPGAEDSYEAALKGRPVLAALSARTLQAEIEERAARNRVLPSLSLTVSGGLTGLSGSLNPSPLLPGNGSAFEGDYGDSLSDLFSGRYYTGFLGLSAEVPWGFRRDRADWTRARAALARNRLAAEGLRATIRAEVRKARGDLLSAIARMEASDASVSAADAALQAEERKRELGASTAIEVLRVQQDYAEALLAQARAEADAYVAQTRLWRAVGVILDRVGITVR